MHYCELALIPILAFGLPAVKSHTLLSKDFTTSECLLEVVVKNIFMWWLVLVV